MGGNAAENVAITKAVLAGDSGPKLDIALVNAAPAIVVAGLADGFADAMVLAAESVDSGSAMTVLERAVAFSSESG